MSRKNTIARFATVAFMAGTSLLGVSATAASAAAPSCPQYGTDLNKTGYLYTNGSVPYHNGPGGNCSVYSNRSGKAYIWCQKYNTYGQLWYYARDESSSVLGWVWSGNVSSVYSPSRPTC